MVEKLRSAEEIIDNIMTQKIKKNILILNDNLGLLRKKYNVANIGIFGSYARGDQKRNSDIDILVEFAKPVGFFKFVDLENYLKKILGREVDLATKDSLKPDIKADILKEVIYV